MSNRQSGRTTTNGEGGPLISIQAVAEHLGVSPATVRYWIHTGAGPRSYLIGRHRRFRLAEVERWVDEQAS